MSNVVSIKEACEVALLGKGMFQTDSNSALAWPTQPCEPEDNLLVLKCLTSDLCPTHDFGKASISTGPISLRISLILEELHCGLGKMTANAVCCPMVNIKLPSNCLFSSKWYSACSEVGSRRQRKLLPHNTAFLFQNALFDLSTHCSFLPDDMLTAPWFCYCRLWLGRLNGLSRCLRGCPVQSVQPYIGHHLCLCIWRWQLTQGS